MKFKSFYILISISTLFFLSSCGLSKKNIPKDFVETVPPKARTTEWYPLNYSKNVFNVKIVDKKLKITKIKNVNKCQLNISNGELVGIDKGEWGGSLTFIPTDTTKNTVKIKGGNIRFIFTFKNKTYFIEGLAHMGYNAGALFELDTNENIFTYKKILDFNDAPSAFTIYKDKFLIATQKNFYIVQDLKKELIFQDLFWNGLRPNSIAVLNDKNVFIGITSGIVKLDLTSKTLKFYKNIN